MDTQSVLVGATLAASLIVAIATVRNGTPSAAALVVLPFAALWAFSRPGLGLCFAIGAILALPQTIPHIWLLPPIAAFGGLIAGATKPRWRGLDLAMGALAVWVALSWLLHRQFNIPSTTLLQTVLPLCVYFAIRLTVSRSLLRMTLWGLLLAGSAGALSVLYDWATSRVHFVDPTAYQWVSTPYALFRAGGVFGGSPAAAVCLAIVSVAVIPLFRDRRRLVVAAGIGLMLWATIVPFGRAGLIGLGVGLLVTVILLPVRIPRLGAVLGVVTAAVLIVVLYASLNDTSPTQGISKSTLYQQGVVRPGSAAGRTHFLSLALPLIGDSASHLVFGRGFDAFNSTNGTYDANMAERPELIFRRGGPHDEYIRAWLEQGAIGFALVICWIGGGLLVGARAARRLPKRSEPRLAVASLTGALAVFAAACFFHDWMHNPVTLSVAVVITGILVSAADHLTRDAPA